MNGGVFEGSAPAPRLRTVPHNIEVERALLGAMLMRSAAFHRVADFLKPDHFVIPAHGSLFHEIGDRVARGGVADLPTLAAFANNDPAMLDCGGQTYLVELAAQAVTLMNTEHYGRTLLDLWKRRELIAMFENGLDRAYGDQGVETTADRILDEHESDLTAMTLSETSGRSRGPVWLKESTEQALTQWDDAAKGKMPALPTGLIDLDDAIGGLFPTDLVILAGRPSMGKSALAFNTAYRVAERLKDQGEGAVLIYSLEQSGDQIVTRDVVGRTGLDTKALRAGKLPGHDLERAIVLAQRRAGLPILIDDRPALAMGQIAASARRHARRDAVKLIVVDYLQLIAAGDRYKGDPTNEVAEVTRGMKALAKELAVPVLLLSQLSRAVEQRENKRPQLSDLRQSGSIEQDADVVMFLFREEYYLERDGEPTALAFPNPDTLESKRLAYRDRLNAARGIAEVIIAKNRHGPATIRKVHFDGAKTLFSNLERAAA